MNVKNKLPVLPFALLVLTCAAPLSRASQPETNGPRARATSAASRFVKQEESVTFARLGRVRVRAVEMPRARPRLEFASEATGRRLLTLPVGTTDPRAYRIEPYETPMNPFVRFAVVNTEGMTGPVVVAVAVKPGGTDHGFETSVIGEVGGRLKLLTTAPLTNSIQGGVFVGDLGAGRGPGLAAWNYVWGDDEAHYAAHRYDVTLLRFDARRGVFRRVSRQRTKSKHEDGREALAELGLPRYENLLDAMPSIKEYRSN